MEIREFEVREVDPELREIVGIAVPYGSVADIGGMKERFERGAFSGELDAQLFYGHDHRTGGMPIGRVIAGRDADDGYEVRARIAKTAKGDEVYTLLREGVLNKFSIGFEPVEHRMDGEVVVRTAARLREVSVVSHPAYATANVSEVRSEATPEERGTPVTDIVTEAADLTELRDTVEGLERQIAMFGNTNQDEPVDGSQFRTAGDALKALAVGDESARMIFRAADTTGPATSAQAGADWSVGAPNWLSRPMRLVQQKRRSINLFDTAPLPPAGNTIEYPTAPTTAGTVAQQVNEGDTLSYMELELGTGTTPVKTYGGYSRLSRQAIERSDVSYLSKVLEFQALQYAKVTNDVVRTALLAASGTNTITTFGSLASKTAKDWINFVIDAAAAIEDNSLALGADFVMVSRDVFKAITNLVDSTGRPIFALNGDGTNTLGNGNLVNAGANIAGLPVVVDPTLPALTLWVAAREAFVTLESPGAPFRLQDENVITLTKDFSLYGYLAAFVSDAKGLVKTTGVTA